VIEITTAVNSYTETAAAGASCGPTPRWVPPRRETWRPLTGPMIFGSCVFVRESGRRHHKVLRGDIGKEIANNEMEKRLGSEVLMYNPGAVQQLANTSARYVNQPTEGVKIRTRPSRWRSPS